MSDFFKHSDIVSMYTSAMAVEDGILLDVGAVREAWSDGLIEYVTTNLIACGYEDEQGNIIVSSLADLLAQAQEILLQDCRRGKPMEWFYSGEIELPAGHTQVIYIELNDEGRYTIMLPEDH